MVADVTRCADEDDVPRNVGRVVAETLEALEVAGDEDEIDAGLDSPRVYRSAVHGVSGISRRR